MILSILLNYEKLLGPTAITTKHCPPDTMRPFFLEQSGGRVTSLPEQDNELPKWWKVILPRSQLNGLVVRAGGGGKVGGHWGTDLIHIKRRQDGHHSV